MLQLISRVRRHNQHGNCKFYLLDSFGLSSEKTSSVSSINLQSTQPCSSQLSGLDDKYDVGRQLGGREDIAGQLLLEIPRTVNCYHTGAGAEHKSHRSL